MRATTRSGGLDPWSPPTIREILDEHMGLIMGCVRSVLGGRREADAQEVAWDTLLHVHRNLHAFDPERGSLRGWIHGVAVQRALRRLRQAQRHARRFVPAADVEEELANVADDGPSVEEMMQTHDWLRLWEDILPTLPEDDRTALVMRVQRGLTAEEIATELVESVGTIKTRLRRAIKAIEAYLHRRQAAQGRRGAVVFPMSAATFIAKIGEASQEVSDALRARLESRLQAQLNGAADDMERDRVEARRRARLRPRLPLGAASLASGGAGPAPVVVGLVGALVLALTLLLIVLLIPVLLGLRSSPGTATGAPATTPASALVATASSAAAPVTMPSASPSGTTAGVGAPASAQAPPAPGVAHVGAALETASTSAQRRAIVMAFTRAITKREHGTACAVLREYDRHHFVGAGAVADRAEMIAKASPCHK